MLRAATGERVATREAWIDRVDDGGRAGVVAVVVAVGLSLAAMAFALVVMQGAIADVSHRFAPASTQPLPSITVTH